MIDVTFAALSTHRTEQPTLLFRWKAKGFDTWLGRDMRVLQQKWQVLETDAVSGRLLSMKEEWRPIPTVGSDTDD
jgi:hypothetical protein